MEMPLVTRPEIRARRAHDCEKNDRHIRARRCNREYTSWKLQERKRKREKERERKSQKAALRDVLNFVRQYEVVRKRMWMAFLIGTVGIIYCSGSLERDNRLVIPTFRYGKLRSPSRPCATSIRVANIIASHSTWIITYYSHFIVLRVIN